MELSGHVNTLPLSDLVQACAAAQRSCRIRLVGANLRGSIYLRNGQVVHATLGDLQAEDAIYTALAEADLRFRVEPLNVAVSRTVSQPWQQLIMEGAQRKDEQRLLPARTARDTFESAVTILPSAPPRRTLSLSVWALGGIGLAAVAVVALAPWESKRGSSSLKPAAVNKTLAKDNAAPSLLRGARPAHPDPSLAIDPTVIVRFRVDEAGLVTDRSVFHPRPEISRFEAAALLAVKDYQFSPARKGGQNVEAWLNWPVTFNRRGRLAARPDVSIKGSDTIASGLGLALAAGFEAAQSELRLGWEGLGSTSGFLGLFDGSADIAASTRSATAFELAEAARMGVTLREHVIGHDGVAVVVHPTNPVAALSMDQIAALFRGLVTNWREVGGPDRPVVLIGRPVYSGTRAFFETQALRGGDPAAPATFSRRMKMYESSLEVRAAVAEDPGAIGYVSLAWLSSGVRPLKIRTATASVVADAAHVRDGRYPLRRALFLYTRGAPAGNVADFLRFAQSAEGQALVARQGFVERGAPEGGPSVISEGAPAAAVPQAKEDVDSIRVLFSAGSASLTRAARTELGRVAMELRRPNRHAIVTGHSDPFGAGKANQRLSMLRAKKVARYLASKGVRKDWITLEADRTDAPVASNRTSAGRNLNRRVDVIVFRGPTVH